jgi:hypothetical protein
MIRNGDLTGAKRQAKAVLADAEPHDLAVIAHCAHILETWPRIGVLKLRAYWQSADERDRSIIAACAPEQDDRTFPTPLSKRTHAALEQSEQIPGSARRAARGAARVAPAAEA